MMNHDSSSDFTYTSAGADSVLHPDPPAESSSKRQKLFSTAESIIQALHFEKALALIQDHKKILQQDPFVYAMFMARIERGLYHYEKALEYARQAVDSAINNLQKETARTEQAKALFSMGKVQESLDLMEKTCSVSDPSFIAVLAWAFMLVETGRMNEAQPLLQNLQEQIESGSIRDSRLILDACILLGDCASFCEDPKKANFWYQESLERIDREQDEQWKALRKAMLFNNWGDLFEQQDSYGKALEYYEKALLLIESDAGSSITDISAYILEILFSIANVYANMDENDPAWQTLMKISKLLESHPPRQTEVFEARLLYMKGLLKVYEDTSESLSLGQDYLTQAYEKQQILYEKGLVKLEHIGKTAYYLANSLQWDPSYSLLRRSLLEKALAVFMKVRDKEPSFYLSGIAELENDLGTSWLYENPSKSLFYYETAVQDYEAYIRRYPQDVLGKESWLYTTMNLALALQASGSSEDWTSVENLISRMEEWEPHWPELYPAITFLSERIVQMENLPESLYRQTRQLQERTSRQTIQA